jgi:flagellar protein FliS
MLYDKLISDLAAAEAAMHRGDIAGTGDRIGRAQEILLELASTLDTDAWPEGEPLRRLYLWMVGELWQARLRKAPERVLDCRQLIEPLRDAWRIAAIELGQPQVAAAMTSGAL